MKKLLLMFALLTLLISCSKEEKKLELKDINIFAFSLGEDWELNATAAINGFEQTEEGDEFKVKISYYVNLVTPAGDTLPEIDYGIIDIQNNEEILIAGVEVQVQLDSSFNTGNYKMLFYINDDLSGKTAQAEKFFELTPD